MSPRSATGVVAGVVLLVGLILGFLPHSIALDFTPIRGSDHLACGSAFAPSDDKSAAQLASAEGGFQQVLNGDGSATSAARYEAECSSALGTPRAFSLTLIGLGLLAGLFVLLTSIGRDRPYAAAPETPNDPPAATGAVGGSADAAGAGTA